jgi:hypothetical protein
VSSVKHPVVLALAVLAVIVGIAFANEARLNRNEPRCRYWADVPAFGCAEHREPHLPPFLLPVQHALMPKDPKGRKRSADVISNAVTLTKIATDEIELPPDTWD